MAHQVAVLNFRGEVIEETTSDARKAKQPAGRAANNAPLPNPAPPAPEQPAPQQPMQIPGVTS